MDRILNPIGDWNPQLFRELKGRFSRKNVAIAFSVACFSQFLLYLFYLGELPNTLVNEPYNRYCTGPQDDYWRSTYQCLRDGNDWLLNWQLWHFDVFVALTLIGLGILLVVGTHLIGADIAKEEQRGTLGFVRLSPQPVSKILLGKLLGVPSLIYIGLAFVLPWHLWLGFQGGIALGWLMLLYGVAIAASLTVFMGAALWSLVGSELLGGFHTWLYSGGLSLYLFGMSVACFEDNLPSDTPFDWVRIFYPGNIFYYLVDQNSLAPETIGYFLPHNWFLTQWYGSSLWVIGLGGLGFMAIHYVLLGALAWQGIRRRFYDPQATIITKTMGCGVAIISTIFMTGFVWAGDRPERLFANFQTLQGFYWVVMLGLILLLTPTRQRVQDWARFRHQDVAHRRFKWAFFKDDRSPALGAIALMLLLTTGYQMAIVLLSPMPSQKLLVITALGLQGSCLFLLGILTQWIFLRRQKRAIWFGVAVIGPSVVPFLLFMVFHGRFTLPITLGLFSAFPLGAVAMAVPSMVIWSEIAQWGVILGCLWGLQQQIQRLGQSDLKTFQPTPTE